MRELMTNHFDLSVTAISISATDHGDLNFAKISHVPHSNESYNNNVTCTKEMCQMWVEFMKL